jgi:hypothetical protein
VTQTGSGNALLVEDSTNPDSTPFVIDQNGTVMSVNSTAIVTQTGTARFQAATISALSGVAAGATATNAGTIDLSRSRGTTSSPTIVSSGDSAGRVSYGAYDGAAFIELAKIEGQVDGTPGTNDMPGRLVFSTTADGASTPTERMRIDASGNVGIGTTSPANKLHVNGGVTLANYANIGATGNDAGISLTGGSTTNNGGQINLRGGSFSGHSNGIEFIGGGTERARIDSSGTLLVGTTTTSGFKDGKFNVNGYGTFSSPNAGTASVVFNNDAGSGTRYFTNFVISGSVVGAINSTGTSTTYSTSSDYRLKENVQPMTGALAKVQALKPVTYKWKSDGSDGEGFIAHELQEVCPDAVTGEKDAVDAEGNPVYQGIDTSFLVATLTAAIQELKGIVDQQAARIAALEGAAP